MAHFNNLGMIFIILPNVRDDILQTAIEEATCIRKDNQDTLERQQQRRKVK